MSEVPSTDRPPIEVVRRDLQEMRSKARASGILRPKDNAAPPVQRNDDTSVLLDMGFESSGDKGKQAASKMLAMFRRGPDDTSPVVPGTDFTEKGVARVVKLLATPREREGASQKMLQRLHKFLTGPVADGAETVAGVGAQKIRRVARMLQQVERHGWEHVRAHMAKRKSAGAGMKPQPIAEPKVQVAEVAAPAQARPKRRARS